MVLDSKKLREVMEELDWRIILVTVGELLVFALAAFGMIEAVEAGLYLIEIASSTGFVLPQELVSDRW